MLLIIILLFHIFLLNNLTFTAWPEMLSYSYLLSNGFSLYKEIIMPYTPGLVFLEIISFGAFGYSILVLKVLTWLLVLIVDILMYLNLSKITNKKTTAFFLIIFVLLQSFLDGNMLWFDFASLIPLLLAIFFLIDFLKKENLKALIFVSFSLSLAIFIKQIALIYFLLFLLIFLIVFISKKKNLFYQLIYIFLGAVIIFAPFLIYLLTTQTLIDFLLWTIYYPMKYWSNFPGYIDLEFTKGRMLIMTLILTPIFFSFLFLRKLLKNSFFLFILAFFIASVLVVYPRFSYFHLQPLIAIFVVLSAIIFTNLEGKFKITFIAVFLVCTSSLLIFFGNELYIGNSIRFYNEEDIKISQLISDRISKNEKVFLLGLPSSYYVFSNTLPPKPWADNFGWYLEIPGIQGKIIEGFRKEPPKIIFWKRPSSGVWFELGSYQPQKITDYVRNNYQKVDNINSEIEIWRIKN